jgi:hypothetical protein
MTMRVVIFNRDYPGFLRDLYLSRPGLQAASYAEQMAVRNDSLFGVADFYSRNFKAHGHEAAEIHLNNPWLQYAWAREHGLKVAAPPPPLTQARASGWNRHRLLGAAKRRLRRMAKRLSAGSVLPRVPAPAAGEEDWENSILRAQIADFRPDVILNQEMAAMRSPVLKSLKQPGMLVIGQIASSLPENDPFDAYDLVISSLPNQVAWFRSHGVKSELNRLAFDPSALERLGPAPQRDIPLSFVGSLSPDHVSRIAFLEYVATRAPLKVWGNGIERLAKTSPLHACYQGEAWGRDMYEILRRSKITLNFHIDLAEDWANNMRLYEATGIGALLLTDSKRNLAEIFVPGQHVAAYADAEDCVRQIHSLLADDTTRERIAAAGQQHAIKTQNYFLRTMEIAALAETLRSKS